VGNLEFRLGDIVEPPLEDASVDVAILSHALHHAEDPVRAVGSAHRILRAGGQVLVLDLVRHRFEQARERYGDRWLGFAASDLQRWLEEAGFERIEVSVVSREEEPPHFETLLASGVKPEGAEGGGARRGRGSGGAVD
jgi:ArsR family transcriptional regulator